MYLVCTGRDSFLVSIPKGMQYNKCLYSIYYRAGIMHDEEKLKDRETVLDGFCQLGTNLDMLGRGKLKTNAMPEWHGGKSWEHFLK